MSLQKCPFCGSTDLVYNPARGDTVCGNPACGELLEEGAMVQEMSFVHTSSGAAAAAGTRVLWTATSGYGGGVQQTSQELAVSRGYDKISKLVEQLQLNTQVHEAARRMYQLAVQMSFTAGRPSILVASSCLYLVCRRTRSPHLLIDFADVLRAPVKTVGRTYMKLVRRLTGNHGPFSVGEGVTIPIIDPSIFIERFARKLDLGPHQRKVQATAMRLIQFMHRDWICVGRRPNGLCGAALLIAAFYHGVRCTAKDVADVVRMQEATLRLRLYEMQQTPLALMNRTQFEEANLDAIEDDRRTLPPCMKRSIRREERAALLDIERKRAEALQDGSAAQGQAALADGARGPGQALLPIQDGSRDADRAAMPPPPVPPKAKPNKRRRVLEEHLDGGEPGKAAPASPAPASPGTGHMPGTPDSEGRVAQPPSPAPTELYTALEPSDADVESLAKQICADQGIQALLEEAPGSDRWADAASRIDSLLKDKPDFAPEKPQAGETGARPAYVDPDEREGSDTLSDFDDELLEMDLLTEEERKDKSDIWHEVNKDYLEEWHLRSRENRRRQQKHSQRGSEHIDSASETGSGSQRTSRHGGVAGSASSAMMALSKKVKGPVRINFEALESLFV